MQRSNGEFAGYGCPLTPTKARRDKHEMRLPAISTGAQQGLTLVYIVGVISRLCTAGREPTCWGRAVSADQAFLWEGSVHDEI